MTRNELVRLRRCRALQLAIALGILFPIFTRTWQSLLVAAIGVTVAGIVYRRNCRAR
jgi:hypothetical protein